MPDEMQPLADLVEPMVWVYAEDVYRFVPSYTWDRYSQVFNYFWTASAFKVTTIIFFKMFKFKCHFKFAIFSRELMEKHW